MSDVEIGRGKTGRRAYSLAEIGIVPARRTRDPEEVSIAWQIDAYRFDLPLMACPMDSVVSPATAASGPANGTWPSTPCGTSLSSRSTSSWKYLSLE